jgi:hypothetical protein
MGPRGPQPGQAVSVPGDAVDHAPGGRIGGDLTEQLRLVPQHCQVAQAVATIGQHHRQIPKHGRVRMPPAACGPRQPSAPVSPTRSASSRSNAASACPTTPVPSIVTSKLPGELVACTRKVPSLSRDCDLQTAAFSLLERAPCVISRQPPPTPHEKPRLLGLCIDRSVEPQAARVAMLRRWPSFNSGHGSCMMLIADTGSGRLVLQP